MDGQVRRNSAQSGYNAALLAHLVGAHGRVVTLDVDDDLAAQARTNLASAGVPNVTVVQRDGWQGYAEAAPFDRIILTVAADDLAPAWHEQLTPDGRLLLPLVLRAGLQKCVAFERRGGTWVSVSVRDCGFMTLRGEHAVTSGLPRVHDDALGLTLNSHTALTVAQLAQWLAKPPTALPTDVRVSLVELWRSLTVWLALYVAEPCVVTATGAALERKLVPSTWVVDREPAVSVSYGSAGAAGISLIHSQHGAAETTDDARTSELVIQSYGSHAARADQLRNVIRSWDAAGRPTTDDVSVRAYDRASSFEPTATEVLLDRPSSRLVVDVTAPAASEPPSDAANTE